MFLKMIHIKSKEKKNSHMVPVCRFNNKLNRWNTDNRHIIPVKSQGFFQTPQDIMGEYNGCSVPQYTAYPSYGRLCKGGPFAFPEIKCDIELAES